MRATPADRAVNRREFCGSKGFISTTASNTQERLLRGVALAALLRAAFQDVMVSRCWSTQAPALQRFGDWLGIANTFGIEVTGRTA